MGRLQLRIVLSINAAFACLAVWVMGVEVFTENKPSLSLGILAITFLTVSSCLALGADWARIVSAGLSAVVVIASLTIILTRGGLNIITFVSLVFGLIFFSSAYLLYFSKPMQAELKERWIRR
jgi:hypothetical protein